MSLESFLKQSKIAREQQQWEFDLERYYRYRRFFEIYQKPVWLEMMQEVKAKYPNHQECFE